MRDFRKYEVWKQGMEIAGKLYKLTANMPIDEKFGLASQMKRCAVSIPSNIAEGASRSSEKEFSRYTEVETQVLLSKNIELFSTEDSDEILNELHTVQKKLNALRTKLK